MLKELKDLLKRPEEGIRVSIRSTPVNILQNVITSCTKTHHPNYLQVVLNEDNIADVEAELDGPGT